MSFGRNFRGGKALVAGFGVIATLLIAGCSSDKELEYKEQSVYEIYSQALGYLEEEEYKKAAQYFDEVERQHPYSVWATKAKLMAAYALYQNNKYDDAINGLERFIAVHPGNRDVAYAYYLKALCYYEQIAEVQRDQDLTRKAMDALQDVVTRFPGTVYARDARLKIDLTRDHLAGKEMSIGRFYHRRLQFLAAINRYKVVVEQYGDTTHAPEALERLTEAFMTLGLVDEATKTAAVLGFNYPGSDWYEDAYKLVYGKPPNPGRPLDKAEIAAAMEAEALAAQGKKPDEREKGKPLSKSEVPPPPSGPSADVAPPAPPPGDIPPPATVPAPAAAPSVGPTSGPSVGPSPDVISPPAAAPSLATPPQPEADKAQDEKAKDEKPADEKPKQGDEKNPWWKLW